MKKIILVLLLSLPFSTLTSQTHLNTGYLISEGWLSIPLIASTEIGNSSINFGIAVGKNSMLIYDHNYVFKRQMYGQIFFQRISYHLGYDYNFKLPELNWYPSLFVHFAYSHAPMRSRIFTPIGYDADHKVIYQMKDKYLPPVNFYEGYLGVKLNYRLFPKLIYFQTIGVGGLYVTDFEGAIDGNDGDFGVAVSLGLSYQISK